VATRQVDSVAGKPRFQREVRVIPTQGEADFVDVDAAIPIGPEVSLPRRLTSNIPSLVVGDIFPDRPGNEIALLSFADGVDGPWGAIDVIGRKDDGTLELVDEVRLDLPTPSPSSLARLRLVDFDGDGKTELVGLVAASSAGGAHYFSAASGKLTEEPLTVEGATVGLVFDAAQLEPPECVGLDALNQERASATPPEVSVCAKNRGLAFATFGDLIACDRGPSSAPTGCRKLFQDSQLTGAVLVRDFDSDGLEDVALLRITRVEIHHQCSVREVLTRTCVTNEEVR
jgi:hypothetical protein